MKIDLRKTHGIRPATPFSQPTPTKVELSEEERIVDTIRRHHASQNTVSESTTLESTPPVEQPGRQSSKRNPLRELLLLIILLVVSGYYMQDRGLLKSSIAVVSSYWTDFLGLGGAADTLVPTVVDSTPVTDVLPEDVFNELMPVTPDLAALADSMAAIQIDTQTADSEYLPVAQQPIQLSDDDMIIINNRSLLLLATDILGYIPADMDNAHLFIKRDALTLTASHGGEWVAGIKSALDRFVLGNYNENYGTGRFRVTSKFEIIMNAEQDFKPQILTGTKPLLDVLAAPFNKYLDEIIVDLPKGIDHNPAKFTFSGPRTAMVEIMNSWAEARTNILLRSSDLVIHNGTAVLTLDTEFIPYEP